MLRAGAQKGLQVQPQVRTYAVPALSDVGNSAASTVSWLGKLLGSSSRINTPMSDPLPGVEVPPPSMPSKAPTTEMTTLPNGVRIASEATPGPTTTLGIYVNSGSQYEGPHQTGMSHLLEYIAFRTTSNRTTFRLVREVESIGANAMASASREQMAYTMDCVRSAVPEAVEILTDAVLNPKFLPWEVAGAIARIREDVKNVKDNPYTVVNEGLHEVAYSGGLARPLIAPESALDGLSADGLAEFVAQNYTAPRIVLSGAGVTQKELVSLAEPLLSGLPKAAPQGPPASKYVGGDFRQYATGDVTHAMLAFEFANGWTDIKGSVAVTVLQFLLGGGGSFSAGGPGKGMHSRLFRRVLNKYDWVQNCTAFSSVFQDTGLVGIFITADKHPSDLMSLISKELQDVAQGVQNDELERAKLAAVSSVNMNLETRAVVAEDIGRQILTYGDRKPTMDFIKAMQELTPQDISKLVTKMLKTPPTVAVLGDIANVPRYDAIASRFR